MFVRNRTEYAPTHMTLVRLLRISHTDNFASASFPYYAFNEIGVDAGISQTN